MIYFQLLLFLQELRIDLGTVVGSACCHDLEIVGQLWYHLEFMLLRDSPQDVGFACSKVW